MLAFRKHPQLFMAADLAETHRTVSFELVVFFIIITITFLMIRINILCRKQFPEPIFGVCMKRIYNKRREREEKHSFKHLDSCRQIMACCMQLFISTYILSKNPSSPYVFRGNWEFPCCCLVSLFLQVNSEIFELTKTKPSGSL